MHSAWRCSTRHSAPARTSGDECARLVGEGDGLAAAGEPQLGEQAGDVGPRPACLPLPRDTLADFRHGACGPDSWVARRCLYRGHWPSSAAEPPRRPSAGWCSGCPSRSSDGRWSVRLTWLPDLSPRRGEHGVARSGARPANQPRLAPRRPKFARNDTAPPHGPCRPRQSMSSKPVSGEPDPVSRTRTADSSLPPRRRSPEAVRDARDPPRKLRDGCSTR